jgi:hypothetical protein
MQDIEQSIRERAYQLWTEDCCPDGHADTHWLAAQRELLSTALGEIGRVTIAEARAIDATPKAKMSRKKKRVT